MIQPDIVNFISILFQIKRLCVIQCNDSQYFENKTSDCGSM